MTGVPALPTEPRDERPSGLPAVAYWFAGALLIAYLVAVVVLWGQVKVNDLQWTRRLYLLAGLEGLAFGAAGAVFGVAVQRQTTKQESQAREEAEGERDEARRRASDLEQPAAVGRAIEAVVRAKADAQVTGAGRRGRFAGRDAEDAPTVTDPLLRELLGVLDSYDTRGESR